MVWSVHANDIKTIECLHLTKWVSLKGGFINCQARQKHIFLYSERALGISRFLFSQIREPAQRYMRTIRAVGVSATDSILVVAADPYCLLNFKSHIMLQFTRLASETHTHRCCGCGLFKFVIQPKVYSRRRFKIKMLDMMFRSYVSRTHTNSRLNYVHLYSFNHICITTTTETHRWECAKKSREFLLNSLWKKVKKTYL